MTSPPRIDSHQHFWRLARGDYGWLTPALKPIHRDFEPAALAPHLAQHDIASTILVQAAATEAADQPALHLARLRESLAALLDGERRVNEERLAQEVALLATKSDVREELDRLSAHIEEARRLLTSGEAQTAPPFIPTIIGVGGQDWPAVAAGATLFLLPVMVFTILLR